MNTRQNIAQIGALLFLLLITALIYWPGLNGPLILDDVANLDTLRVLAEQGRLDADSLLAERSGWFAGRSVSWLSFLWSWRIAPADVWVFKFHNLLLHLLNGALVFFFARLLFSSPVRRADSNAALMGLLVCAFWLYAPIQVSSVLYLVQRMSVLAGTFVLLGLLSYCYGRRLAERRPALSVTLIAFSLLVCWPLGTLSKETGALLPMLLLVAEVFVGFGAGRRTQWAPGLVAVLCVAILAAGLLRALVEPGWITHAYELRDFSLSQRLLTQPRVLVDYALNILQLPGGSELGLFHDDFVVSKSLSTPPTTPVALVFIVAVLVLGWRMRTSTARLVFFGLTFFLVAHSLEAGPFALEIYFEHRNYLPSLGLWIALVAAASLLFESWARPWLWGLVVFLCLGLHATNTLQRVLIWSSWDGIISANLRAHPESVRAHAGAAARALAAQKLDMGLTELATVQRLGGSAVNVAVSLKRLAGYCIAERSPGDPVYHELARLSAIRDDPYTISALRWLAEVAESGQCTTIDLPFVAARLQSLTDSQGAFRYFGFRWMLDDAVARINEAAGRHDAAIALFLRALRRAPNSARAGIRARLKQLRSQPIQFRTGPAHAS